MKIYLAGSCSSEQRTIMVKVAQYIRQMDYNIELYCPFELKIPNAWNYSQEKWAELVFDSDKKAIDECDLFLMISQGRISSAGTNWEQGYAYAKGKYVAVIQCTDQPTSLMTFCGCARFENTSTKIEDIIKCVDSVIGVFSIEPNPLEFGWSCSTLLT